MQVYYSSVQETDQERERNTTNHNVYAYTDHVIDAPATNTNDFQYEYSKPISDQKSQPYDHAGLKDNDNYDLAKFKEQQQEINNHDLYDQNKSDSVYDKTRRNKTNDSAWDLYDHTGQG